jgi:hypothetical protein
MVVVGEEELARSPFSTPSINPKTQGKPWAMLSWPFGAMRHPKSTLT